MYSLNASQLIAKNKEYPGLNFSPAGIYKSLTVDKSTNKIKRITCTKIFDVDCQQFEYN